MGPYCAADKQIDQDLLLMSYPYRDWKMRALIFDMAQFRLGVLGAKRRPGVANQGNGLAARCNGWSFLGYPKSAL